MLIKSLSIQKFRAVENVDFQFKDGINAFGGENGVGKTTVLDSILWMLSDDTLITGQDNSKNLDDNASDKPIHVEMTLELASGVELNLKREYQPKFTKEGTFASYSNKFWINDASYTATEYFKRLKKEFGIVDPEIKKFNILRALIDFDYFGTIDYQIARDVIENILHLETAGDIINKEKYMLIKNDLIGQNYDIAKTKTMYNSQKDIKENEINKLKENIKVLKENIKPLDKNKLEELTNNYNILKSKEYEHSAEYKTAYDKVNTATAENNELYKEISKLKDELTLIEIKNENILKPLDEKTKEVESLRKEFVRVKSSVKKCPNCNYELNHDEILNELKEMSDRGKKLAQEIKELSTQVKTEELNALRENVALKEKEYKQKMKELDVLRNDFDVYIEKEDNESASFYRARQEKLDELGNEISQMKSESNTTTIDNLTEQLQTYQNDLAKLLVKKELLVDFEIDKINEINDKVKSVFPNIDFVLIEVSDRGAEKKTCKPQFNGVDYLRLNDGQRIKIGFEIIDGLTQAFNIKDKMPIIFDKLRDLSKTNIIDLKEKANAQIFTTFVGNEDKINLYEM